jgi:hypothetical protein
MEWKERKEKNEPFVEWYLGMVPCSIHKQSEGLLHPLSLKHVMASQLLNPIFFHGREKFHSHLTN